MGQKHQGATARARTLGVHFAINLGQRSDVLTPPDIDTCPIYEDKLEVIDALCRSIDQMILLQFLNDWERQMWHNGMPETRFKDGTCVTVQDGVKVVGRSERRGRFHPILLVWKSTRRATAIAETRRG
jgi:hypothetical protein